MGKKKEFSEQISFKKFSVFGWMCVCVSVYVCLSILFQVLSCIGYYRVEFPVLYSRSLLIIYFIYSSVYVLISVF